MDKSFIPEDDIQNTNPDSEEEIKEFLPDIDKLKELLPVKITNHFQRIDFSTAIEINMQVGRLPEIRHAGGRVDFLGNIPILFKDIAYITERYPQIQEMSFVEIPQTLHRLKTSRDFQNKISGITCSLGRFATESIDCINDIVTNGKSILFLGRPKSGKTTKLREAAILWSSDMGKNVVVIDPHKDILGEDDNLHPVLKNVKRVVGTEDQFKKDLLLEADEIFSPDVFIVDEISTKQEIDTIKTLTDKGKVVIASMLGTSLEKLMKTPALFDSIGGIKTINFTEKEENENLDIIKKPSFKRVHSAVFKTLIEILNVNTFSVYENTEEAVDSILDNYPIHPVVRTLGQLNILDERYKNSNFEEDNKKDVRRKSMKALIQESFFHGASWMGQNFIA